MFKVALTGSIASGKSLVLRELSNYFKIIDLDEITAKLYNKLEVQNKLLNEFGSFDRKKLTEIIFNDFNKKKKLELILWPLILDEMNKQLKLFEEQEEKIVIVDVPLLFEAKIENKFDFIVVVACKRDLQIQRLLMKGKSISLAEKMIESQMPLTEKINKADFVIDNSGSINETLEQVSKLKEKLLLLANK